MSARPDSSMFFETVPPSDVVIDGSIPRDRGVPERLLDRVRTYARLGSRCRREAEACREQGRWAKAARLERQSEFYRFQGAIFLDALCKVGGGDDGRLDVSADEIERDTTGREDVVSPRQIADRIQLPDGLAFDMSVVLDDRPTAEGAMFDDRTPHLEPQSKSPDSARRHHG